MAQVLRHTTSMTGNLPSYDRPECLGDSVLDFILMYHLYRSNLQASPGVLTTKKVAAGNSNMLGAISVYLDGMILCSNTIRDTIANASSEIQSKANRELYQSGIFFLMGVGDVFESIMGAVFFDASMNLSHSSIFFQRVVIPFLNKYVGEIQNKFARGQNSCRLCRRQDAQSGNARCNRFRELHRKEANRSTNLTPPCIKASLVVLATLIRTRSRSKWWK